MILMKHFFKNSIQNTTHTISKMFISKKFLLYFLVSASLHWPSILSRTQDEGVNVNVQCVDDWSDFETHNWESTTVGQLEYAENSQELPTILEGLSGNGLFYFESLESHRFGQGVIRNTSDLQEIQPYHLYIKYYAHQASDLGQIVVFPSADSLYTYLPLTSNFQWQESLVQVDPVKWTSTIIGAWVWEFDVGEFFIIDKIILAQGHPNIDMEGIKNLCPWDEVDPTSSTTEQDPGSTMTTTWTTEETTTTTSTTTTTTPAPSFSCHSQGYFPDPTNCSLYHFCQYNGVGDLWDTIMTCDLNTVWCQESLQCESEDVCPCSIF